MFEWIGIGICLSIGFAIAPFVVLAGGYVLWFFTLPIRLVFRFINKILGAVFSFYDEYPAWSYVGIASVITILVIVTSR
jgi:heme/copper-type cytochrome/quinol oxidase subunit 4